METVSVLRLNQQQIAKLTAHCTTYRAYLWKYLLPSPERNQALRIIQALQARLLIASQKPTQAEIALPLSPEEGTLLHHLFHVLMKPSGKEPHAEKHTPMRTELAAWCALLERLPHRTYG